jgi:AAA+ superfamily predicted ATPase
MPTSFNDYIGNQGIIDTMIEQLITYHNTNVMEMMALNAGSSIILHGPGGTGKTLFAKKAFQAAQQIAEQYGEHGLRFKWFEFKCSEIVSKYRGEAVININAKFKEISDYINSHPQNKAFVLFDEFDSLARTVQGQSENDEAKNILNELKILLANDLLQANSILIACTNNFDMLDEAVVRDGRFNNKIFIDYTTAMDDIRKLVKFFLKLKSVSEEISDGFIEQLVKLLFASGITTPVMVKNIIDRAVVNSTNEMVRVHPMFNFQIIKEHTMSAKISKQLIIRYFDEKHLHSSLLITVEDLLQRVNDTDRLSLIRAILPIIVPEDDTRNIKGHPDYIDPILAICRVKPGNLRYDDPNITAEEIRCELFYYRERLDLVAKDPDNIQRLKALADKLTELETPPVVVSENVISQNPDSEIEVGELVEDDDTITPDSTVESNPDALALAIVKYSYPE